MKWIEKRIEKARNERRLEVVKLHVENIDVPDRKRAVNPEAVKALASSMEKIGLKTPITIRTNIEESDAILVAGLHRLEAAKLLGWEKIDCIVMIDIDYDDINVELWEISENLHRAELTQLERGEQIGRWVALSKQKVSAQVATKPQGGRPESGERRASRELGLDKDAVHRAVRVSKLTEEAKATARELGLDDNQSALLEAARAIPENQAEVIHNIADAKQKKSAERTAADRADREAATLLDLETLKTVWRSSAAMQAAWKRATGMAQSKFSRWLECGAYDDDDIDGGEG